MHQEEMKPSDRFRKCLILVLLFVAFGGAVNAETGKRPDPQAVARGKVLYEKYCQTCHKKDGVGEPSIPVTIRKLGYFTAMPLNETSHAWHHTDEQLVETILQGLQRTSRMPAFKNLLMEKQAYDIVAYIKSLWSARILACQGPKHMSCM
jgi:mono/diheme cytochrome c family protein